MLKTVFVIGLIALLGTGNAVALAADGLLPPAEPRIVTASANPSVDAVTGCSPTPGFRTVRCWGHFTASASGSGLLVSVRYDASGTFSVVGSPGLQHGTLSGTCSGATGCSIPQGTRTFQDVVLSSDFPFCTTSRVDASNTARASNAISQNQRSVSDSDRRDVCV